MLTRFVRTARWSFVTLLAVSFLTSSASSGNRPLSNLEEGMNELIYSLSRSVVSVICTRALAHSSLDGTPGGLVQSQVYSGLVVDGNGHVLVAAESVVGQDRLHVDIDNMLLPAKVVGIDYHTDLALLDIGRPVGSPVQFSQRQVCAGQMIVAMGNAYGMRASPTIGFCAGARPDGTMQFSAPIPSGSVGGGVFDLGGNLLGVIVGSIGQNERVVVAVPGYRLAEIVSYLTTHGDRKAGYIGVSTADVELTTEGTEPQQGFVTMAGQTNVAPQEPIRGVAVTFVAPHSPANCAGIRRGDVIIGFNGTSVQTANDLCRLVKQAVPGTSSTLAVIRLDRIVELPVQVGAKSYQFADLTEGDDAAYPSADSLKGMLDYLKREVQRLETRIGPIR